MDAGNQTGSFPGSNFFAVSGSTTPQSGSSTVGAAGGIYYAVSDAFGPGTHALLQTFTVSSFSPSVLLTFSMFANSYDGKFVNPIGLDFTDGANQHARVDILTAGSSPFDTGAGVLLNLYLGTDAGANPHAYTNYLFDITSTVGAGGTFQLRFAEVDNQLYLNLGADNVSITTAPSAVPEPSALLPIGLIALIALALKAKLKHIPREL